jgi:hypothetical protein
MDAAESPTLADLQRRLADLERARDDALAARAAAQCDARRLAERYADLDARWRRSSVGGVILFRAAQQVWTRFSRWQDALARHRPDAEVDTAWSAFDRTMAGLPAALSDSAARPDSEPVEAIEHLVAAIRALLAAARPAVSARPGTAPAEQPNDGEGLIVDGRLVEAAERALERYEKLRWLARRETDEL